MLRNSPRSHELGSTDYGGQLKQKLVSLLLALAFAQYAPAQGATSVDLVGVGGTFALPIHTKWFAEYGTANGGVRFHYLPRGSAEGISNASSGSSDFGSSEAPINDEQLAKAPTTLLLLPSVVGGVVPIYNLPGIRQELRFTSEVLARIYLGTIRDWNDPAIAAINPGVSLPHQRIAVFYRGDPSGTSYIWTEFLSKVSSKWKRQVGYGITVNWPIGEPSMHSGGNLARSVQKTPNSIGYVDLTLALEHGLQFGSIRNSAGSYVKADLKSLSAAAASMAKSIRGEDFRVSLTDASGESSYPVASFTWFLVAKNGSVPTKGAALRSFLRWMLIDGQAFAKVRATPGYPRNSVVGNWSSSQDCDPTRLSEENENTSG
jgi:phosphate transport system substrate-binding protein